MSWINSRQQQQPPVNSATVAAIPPTAAAATAATVSQSGSVGFGGGGGVGGAAMAQQQQQQQGWQQQPLHSFNHQTPQYQQQQQPQQQPQPFNFFSVPQNPVNVQYSWHHQQQQPPSLKNPQQQQQQLPATNNQYFNKQNPVIDGYIHQNSIASPPSSQTTPQHYQQQQHFQQPQNYSQPSFTTLNSNNSNVSFVKPELQPIGGTTMASTIQQNDNNPPQNEGWDDWEWGENNNQSLQQDQLKQLQQPHNVQKPMNHDVIADSFATDRVDNWKWNTEDTMNSNSLQKPNEILQNQFISHERQHHADSYQSATLGVPPVAAEDSQKQTRPPSVGSASSGYVQTVLQPPQFAAQQMQQTVQQPEDLQKQVRPPSVGSASSGYVQTVLQPPQLAAQQMQQTVQQPEDLQKQVRPPSVGSASSGYVQTVLQPPQFAAQQIQQTVQQPQPGVQQLSQPLPAFSETAPLPIPASLPIPTPQIAQSQPTSIQSNAQPDGSVTPGSSNVYVSQAKPVAQPPRQYAMTPSAVGSATPPNQFDSLPPPPQISSASSLPPPPLNQTPPPPPVAGPSAGNPYKRAGAPQHHRVALAPTNSQQPAQFFGPVSGDFQHMQQNAMPEYNQECPAPDNSEVIVDSKSFEVENQEVAPSNDQPPAPQEVAPSNDRNQYMQTDHLSEEGYNNVELAQEQNEQDNFPPPGLSRLVLGQPEAETGLASHIPPGLDRMVPGTELVTAGINMERQADGQDTMPAPRSTFSNVPPIGQNNSSSNMDITADRNLYLVPGESDVHEQRIVQGLENGADETTSEQREVELDGENLEDQQQQSLPPAQHHPHHQHHQPQHFPADIEITREEPIEGANTLDSLTSPNANHETESSLTIETNQKDMSNPSTANDDSDHKGRHQSSSYYGKSNPRKGDEKRRGHDGKERKERYETESDYYSSDRDRKFREGSVRSDRDRDRSSKDRDRRDRREGSARDPERYRDDKDDRDRRRYDRDRPRGKNDKDRDRDHDRGGRYNSTRYETDSKYETESSVRYERRRGDRGDRGDRDRRDYDYRRDDKDKRNRRGGGDDRNDRDERDRRRGDTNDRDYRDRRRADARGERGRGGGGSSNEFDDDAYSRRAASSRNAREMDREYKDRGSVRDMKDPRYSNSMYGYPAGYGYDAYSYYQHQQYYEQLRRTNPQAYAEWYRKYYGQVQNDVMGGHDGRESVHSGRSSANNDKERYQQYFQHQQQQQLYLHPPSISSSLNSTAIGDQSFHMNGGATTAATLSQYQLQQHQQHLTGGYPVASTARSYYSQNDYLDIRPDQFNASLMDGASTTQEPQRLTPCKFTNEHSIAALANGLMVCVKPKYSANGITNIVKVWKYAPNDATKRLFNSFPGPLVRGITHKKTIIEFCEDQIRLGPPSAVLRSRNNSMSSICSMGQANKASFTLMWTLLILLLRQNGMVVGTDIAELLLKNKNQYPYETNSSNAIKTSSRRNSVQSEQKKSTENRNSQSDDEDGEDANSIEDKEDDSSESYSKKSLSENEITEKFRNYLLYGNVNEALEWATDNNLWGHALFLASKVDRRMHANVMMKFANKLSLNDPLQTLYQLMSGRTPSSVTSVQDEKWGDWRPHLAMILSNTSSRPDLDRKAITTLGDSLYNRGDLFGAQFCYLMAQVGFGRYSAVNQESSFMSNSVNAIRLVLLGSSHHKTFREFATSEAIMMTEIYEYACALNDEKFSIVEFQPYKYLLALRMLDYGMQLKTLMYMEQISQHIQLDPAKYESSFIQKVCDLSERLKFVDPMLEKSMDEQSADINQFEDQPWLQSLRSILSDSNMYASQQVADIPTRTQIDQQFAEINQQFSALSMQYNNYESNVNATQQQPPQQPYSEKQSQDINDPQYQLSTNSGTDSIPPSTDQYGQYYNQQPHQMPSLPGQNATSDYGSYNSQSYDPQPASYEQEQYQQYATQDGGHQQDPNYGYWDQQQQQQSQQNEPSDPNTVDRPSTTTPSMPQMTTTASPLLDSTSRPCSSLSPSSALNNHTVYNRANNMTPTSDTIAVVANQMKQTDIATTLAATSSKNDQTSLEPKRSPSQLSVGTTSSHNRGVVADPIREDISNRLKLPPAASSTPTRCSSSNSNVNDPVVSSPLHAEDTSRPQISMPNSISNKSGFYNGTSNDSSANTSASKAINQSNDSARTAATDKKAAAAKADNKKPISGNSTSNSGWFGGIWNKLSLKPKNQMILPDDKNPAIVWDPDKKRWVNTDGDVDEQESFKPPPKMADIVQAASYNTQFNQQLQQQPPQQQQQPHSNYGPPDVPMMSAAPSTLSQQQSSTSPGQIPSAPTTPAGTNAMSASGNSATAGPTGAGGGDPMKTPSLQSNMFKMQRNRTLKKSYVDVFNPSGAPTKPIEPVLAPMMPSPAVPQAGIFVPAPIPADDGSAQQQSQEGMPQYYNPNQFSGYQQ